MSEPEPDAEPAVACVDDAACIAELGPHGRCVGTRQGLPDLDRPANNGCVVAPRGLTLRFAEPEFTAPAANAPDLNQQLADVWRAQGLQLVLRLDDHPVWQLQPGGGWLPEFSGLLYPTWDGTRVAPGVTPIPLATQPEVCDGADACATLIFVASLSAPMRLPAATDDECAESPFALRGAGQVQLSVDAAGEVAQARLSFGLILGREAANDTPWNAGTLRDLLDAISYGPNIDTNGDGASDGWAFSFESSADADAIAPSVEGAPAGDCLP